MHAYSTAGRNSRGHTAWQILTKVPKITGLFWVIKILTTGMGEAVSDFLVHRINPFLAGAIGFIVFAIALWLQFRQDCYRPWIYWFTVSMVAVFGTMAADGLHVELGVPYILSTIFYAAVLVTVFIFWYRFEGTLSIHSIHTPRREFFYWATVLATFAMGTALGDLTAYNFNFGYFGSGVMFAVIFALPALGYRLLKLSPIVTFWFAYIITRPLGASFADWFGVPKSLGGLDLGRGVVSLALAILTVILVAYAAKTHEDSQLHERRPLL
jgi:uncharacterized membrane-anchored protein